MTLFDQENEVKHSLYPRNLRDNQITIPFSMSYAMKMYLPILHELSRKFKTETDFKILSLILKLYAKTSKKNIILYFLITVISFSLLMRLHFSESSQFFLTNTKRSYLKNIHSSHVSGNLSVSPYRQLSLLPSL